MDDKTRTLLEQSLEFTKYAAAAFYYDENGSGTPEWFEGLREQIVTLQPLLTTALSEAKPALPALKLGEIDLDTVEAAAPAATPLNLDSAQKVEKDAGSVECPLCSGEGSVEIGADYCNFDGVALGVEFYGIGNEHLAAEHFIRSATPAVVLALVRHARATLHNDRVLSALELMLERLPEPPEANCSCHLWPPCNDCTDYGGEREAFEEAKAAIAASTSAKGGAAC